MKTTPNNKKTQYGAAQLSVCCKNVVARFVRSLKKRKVKSKVILKSLKDSNININKRTFQRWSLALKSESRRVGSETKLSGRPRILNDEEEVLLAGFVMENYVTNKSLSLITIKTFLEDKFGKILSVPSISRILRSLGFTRLKKTKKVNKIAPSLNSLIQTAFDYLTEFRDKIFPGVNRKGVLSIDACFSNGNIDDNYAYGPKGGNAQRLVFKSYFEINF